MYSDLNRVIDAVVKDRGLSRAVVIEALKSAMVSAARKRLGLDYNIEAEYNDELGEVELFRFREVVEEVEEEAKEITLEDARKIDPESEIGDELGEKIDASQFGRISAQMAKQVIFQKIRDAEKENIYNEYSDREHEIINGIVRRFEKRNLIIDLGRAEAIMYQKDQIPKEAYQPGDRIRGYVTEVRNTTNAPQIVMSRATPEFMMKLFEMEVPEIAEGTVQIVTCAREPGQRAKIAVASREPNVDPVGACVGMKGSRVQAVVNELRGEKIDIVPYSDNPATFVCNGLAPAEITKVIIDEDNKKMDIVVADDQLSLAIGKRGQNVRLAVQLSGWRLDIHSESQIRKIEKEARRMYQRLTKVPEGQREILIKTGYTDIKDLAEAEIEDLSGFPGIDEELAEEIIDEAYAIHITGEWPLPEPERDEDDEDDFLQVGQADQALAAAHELFGGKKEKAEAEGEAPTEGEAPAEDVEQEVVAAEEAGQEVAAEAAPDADAVAEPAAPEEAEAVEEASDEPVEDEWLDEDDFDIDPERVPVIAGKTAQFLIQRGYDTRNKILRTSIEELSKAPGMGVALAEDLREALIHTTKEDQSD
ncbi:MAG: transcription termination factor NusA [Candidatus Lernaella stagnicola]|nr:transcription termination factor NusA [Candidatus Lernaella stagnicola]